jgi:hypothetical protein
MKGTTRTASTRMAVLAVVYTPMTDAITTNSRSSVRIGVIYIFV